MLRSICLATTSALLLISWPMIAPLFAEEPVDWSLANRIRAEGLQRSRVMDTLQHLTDVIGPRLTGSPALKEANEWTRDRLAEWGLANAPLESYEFGRGWSLIDRGSLNIELDWIQFDYDNFRDITDGGKAGEEPKYSFDAQVTRIYASFWF